MDWGVSRLDSVPRCSIGKFKEHSSAVWGYGGEWGGGLSVGKETRGVSYSAVLYFRYILADVFRHDARDFHGRRTSGGYLKDVGRLAERF